MHVKSASFPKHFLLLGMVLTLVSGWSPATTSWAGESSDPAVQLDPLLVGGATGDGYDVTGMGSAEAELDEPPFSNDLLAGARGEDDLLVELNTELTQVAVPSPVDLATGVNRVNLRGFPTPRLRNGFTQTGIPEALNIERVEMIQGPLTPVTGRAAPGGIQNFVTYRPKGTKQSRLDSGVAHEAHRDEWLVRGESTGPLVPKKLWYRVAAGSHQREGPEDFTYSRALYVSNAVTMRHSRSASTMVMVDFQDLRANPTPGVPEYRPSRNEKIVGPYLPLAYFHTYGPQAGVRKRIGSASVQFEGQMGRYVSVRAGAQGWRRDLREDRFTIGQYLLDTGVMGGTREPQRVEQPLRALAVQSEVTGRFHALTAEHKLSLTGAFTRTGYTREHRALERSDRDQLPADVRTFDPDAPNYYRPEFSADLYRRVINDRHEDTDYSSLALSERAAFWNGRLVASLGGRADFVSLSLDDRTPSARRAHVSDRVSEFTYHAGANYQVVKGRLLVFAGTSTAFEPSTRVDARTGRIQGNETTLGYETGLKGLFFDRRLSATALLFRFYNQNISRRNPLYDDPIADAAQTQPQLVAAGEERFTGGTIDMKVNLIKAWTVSARATVTQAITTASPDLPEEIGRALTRLPRTTVGISTRYAFAEGTWRGLALGMSANYVSGFVASYETVNRRYLAYPDYALVGFNAGYGWKQRGKISHNVNFSLRNAFDRDLLKALARPGAGREVGVGYSVVF